MGPLVVVLPGIMGARLVRNFGEATQRDIWYQETRLALGDALYLQLDDDGDGPGPLAGGVDLTPISTLPSWGGWDDLLGQLRRDKWEAQFWGYDWRKDLRETAARLASFLISVAAERDFYIVAHSMGGLVARLAYAAVVAAGAGSHWKRSVYIGTPHFGSHQSAQYLATPVQQLDMAGYLPLALAFPLPYTLARSGSGKVQDYARQIVASWPALYQLLPDDAAGWRMNDPLLPQLFQAGSYADSNPHVKQKWLDEAKVVRTQLNATLAAPRPSERVVQSQLIDTPGFVKRTTELGKLASYGFDPGDGSVTVSRGTLTGVVTSLFMPNAQHCNQVGDGRLLARITSLLLEEDPEPETVAPLKAEVFAPQLPPISTIEIERPFSERQIRGDP